MDMGKHENIYSDPYGNHDGSDISQIECYIQAYKEELNNKSKTPVLELQNDYEEIIIDKRNDCTNL